MCIVSKNIQHNKRRGIHEISGYECSSNKYNVKIKNSGILANQVGAQPARRERERLTVTMESSSC
jgi:hypothetical protein